MVDSTNQDIHAVAPLPERLRRNEKVIILTANKTEDTEFFYPYYRLTEAGYDVDVVTPDGGAFEAKHGLGLKSSMSIKDVKAGDYKLLYIPGGQAPQELRRDSNVVSFVKEFAKSGNPIAAVCHGPQLLAEADLLQGKEVAAWPEIKGEVEAAGAKFVDEALVVDGQFITSRMPGDLHRHLAGTLDALQGNAQKHNQRSAA